MTNEHEREHLGERGWEKEPETRGHIHGEEPRQPNGEKQASTEALARDGPRIYVASLSDYNYGDLHGRWIDATDDVETTQIAIARILGSSWTG